MVPLGMDDLETSETSNDINSPPEKAPFGPTSLETFVAVETLSRNVPLGIEDRQTSRDFDSSVEKVSFSSMVFETCVATKTLTK